MDDINLKRFFGTLGGFSVVVVGIIAVILILAPLVPTYGSDAEWYIAIAKGHLSEVIKPFSGRVLQPFLVGQISSHLGADISQSFLLVAFISLILFFVVCALFFRKVFLPSYCMIPVFAVPYFAMIWRAPFIPDIFYVFLLSLFFASLLYKREGVGLFILFLLFLTRESTILLGLVLLIASFLRSKKLLSAVTLVVILLSVFITQQVGSLGLPNVHNLGNLTYVVLKVPYNLLNNVFGAKLWVNTLANNCVPTSVIDLPRYLSLGSINKIGFCGFDLSAPFRTVAALLTVFGVMPLVLLYMLFSKFKSIMAASPPWLWVALVYGLVSYFVSVLITGAVERSAGYGWPAFLLTTPFLISMFFQVDKKFLIKLSLIQLFVAWTPVIVSAIGVGANEALWLVLPVVTASYIYTFRSLRAQEKVPVFELDPASVQRPNE